MLAWGLSDPGMVRKENQDHFAIVKLDEQSLLAMVCDGMGGAKSGGIASRMAVDVFSEELSRSWKSGLAADKIEKLMKNGCDLANQAVYEQSNVGDEYDGMGTTLVAAVICGTQVHIVNVGDSRAYHISESGIKLVTTDHSFVQLMVQRGEITMEQAKNHPSKNLITRAIGTEDAVESDGFHLELAEGDSLLLCSDGLSNTMADQEILFEIAHGAKQADCCQRLLEIAKNRGAPDNVTAVLVTTRD